MASIYDTMSGNPRRIGGLPTTRQLNSQYGGFTTPPAGFKFGAPQPVRFMPSFGGTGSTNAYGELGGGFLEEPGHSGAAQVGGWILQEIHDHGVGAGGVCGPDQVPGEHASIRGVVCFLQKRRQGIERNGEPVALGAVGNRAGSGAQPVLSQRVSSVKRLQKRGQKVRWGGGEYLPSGGRFLRARSFRSDPAQSVELGGKVGSAGMAGRTSHAKKQREKKCGGRKTKPFHDCDHPGAAVLRKGGMCRSGERASLWGERS